MTRRERIHEIIFGHDTPAGKTFDIALIVVIILSVLTVMLDSVESVHERYGPLLWAAEWVFTILFTLVCLAACIA